MEINQINELIKLHPKAGDVSDGYHTFNDLYKMRLALTVALFNEWTRQNINNVHKSTKHSDGEPCFGGSWFIVVATVNGKQISFHYEMKYWDLFKCEWRACADKWDGHSEHDVINRLVDI